VLLEQEDSAVAEAPWLWAGSRRSAPPDGSNVGEILRAWRKANKQLQAEVAEQLGWSQPYISQIESGRAKLRDVGQLWHLQRVLGIPPAELGLVNPREETPVDGVGRVALVAGDHDEIAISQRKWRAARARLNRDRQALSAAAAGLYPDAIRVAGSPVISRPEWLLAEPVEFADVGLEWLADVAPAQLNGGEPATEALRPLSDRGTRFARYSHAVRDLDRPTLFENRPGYRLMEYRADGDRPALAFGYTSYFASVVDVSGALAHELAAAPVPTALGELPFRTLVGDPFDLARRPLLPSINTLTIRADGPRSSFLLHYRDPASVVTVAGSSHVMPAGVFQPSSLAPWHQANDFSLWRSSLREFAEELLNLDEADGSSPDPIDYAATEPFAAMDAARAADGFRMFFYGIGLDPVTLCGEILSVAVIDADVFDTLFAELAPINSEGSVLSAQPTNPGAGIPFTQATMHRLLDSPDARTPALAPPAIALLRLAWKDRVRLLG
jgi:transcriptional regulator with XRE-family HTH domain